MAENLVSEFIVKVVDRGKYEGFSVSVNVNLVEWCIHQYRLPSDHAALRAVGNYFLDRAKFLEERDAKKRT